MSTRNDAFDRGEILGMGEVGSLAIDGLNVVAPPAGRVSDAFSSVDLVGVSLAGVTLVLGSGSLAGVALVLGSGPLAGVTLVLGSGPLAGVT